LAPRKQMIVHLCLLGVAALALPIALSSSAEPPAQSNPIPWLLWTLLITAGLPFIVVSASAPILQKWFERSGHALSHDPYFLYAASNVGSLSALLGYPLAVEPHFNLSSQTTIWTTGYLLLIVAFLACGGFAWRRAKALPSLTIDEDCNAPAPGWSRRLHWIALAAVPSSLMLGVTTHITTNVAAVPLLWVIPLAVYLLSFILVFARRPVLPHSWCVRSLPYLVVLLGLLFFAPPQELGWYVIPLHIIVFFAAAMVCHGELAATRPAPRHLTEFYLWMSFGGVLGGLFNALVAPSVFDAVIEYPIAVIAALMLMPRAKGARGAFWLDLCMPLGVAFIAAALVTGMKIFNAPVTYLTMMIVFFVPALLCFQFKERPLRFALSYAAILLVTASYSRSASGDVQLVERNFFGVKKVMFSPDHRMKLLAHGTTNHGCQSVDEALADKPLAYFHPQGPLGDVFNRLISNHRDASPSSKGLNVGIIGLGVGSIAAYLQAGDRVTYYEIDPAVERIARDPACFSFLSRCKANLDVVLGDGRLTLTRAQDGSLNLVVLDAFSSDAIPIHLLSLEAIRMYLSKLDERGILAFHISNGFLNLEPVISRAAQELGLACVSRCDRGRPASDFAEGQLAAHYVIASRHMETVQPLLESPAWHVCAAEAEMPVWTDQYCDLIGAMRLPKASHEPQLAARHQGDKGKNAPESESSSDLVRAH
ncbi:MAG TPA: fused MFS/spermidine synthase, partial [Phycisphaerae bacterium]|nr:fused MFS/spermidine synthase [Phycisphaerae bacterium]